MSILRCGAMCVCMRACLCVCCTAQMYAGADMMCMCVARMSCVHVCVFCNTHKLRYTCMHMNTYVEQSHACI
jgi:hypothetical protein